MLNGRGLGLGLGRGRGLGLECNLDLGLFGHSLFNRSGPRRTGSNGGRYRFNDPLFEHFFNLVGDFFDDRGRFDNGLDNGFHGDRFDRLGLR